MNMTLKQARFALAPLALLVLAGLVMAMRPLPSSLERVTTRGELVVVSRTTPTTWYRDQHGETGFEYELARQFADQLGVSLRMVEAESLPQMLDMVASGDADLAAAGLAITAERQRELRFTSAYQAITDKIVYRLGESRPRRIEDLAGRRIAVLDGSAQEFQLEQLRAKGFDVAFEPVEGTSPERLLTLVDEGYFDLALVDSNAYILHRSLFPELASGFDLAQEQLAWALPRNGDRSLFMAAQRFMVQRKAAGEIARLESRFYGHINSFNYVAARSFLNHIDERLPLYAQVFREAAGDSGFDWRLLAAMGYQESLWNPEAVSPTGVRGLMMLTRNTAREMGIEDRTDAMASIRAGAAYLRKLYDRIPERIADVDRTWMAVAAYNVGMGHLEDARVLTQKQGDDPDRWDDVRKRLPLLRQKEFYRDTRHGYARGGMQSIIYVRHIRRYYDLLVWATSSDRHGPTLVALAN